MKVDLLLEEAIEKLEVCGFKDEADWLKKRQAMLQSTETRIKALRELHPIWAGMGSFHDLPWPPKLESWSWEFVDKIYCAIEAELGNPWGQV